MTSAVMDAASYGNHSDASWVVDHIVPLAQGGANDYYNYQAMHNYCNSCKGDAR
ncbi:HNH endonuclease [Entomoplasma freundtii]|nr:HNH endonuclease [Entomoplasma freundtii]